MERLITITDVEQIFNEGNKHLKEKGKHFGTKGLNVVKYILDKLRKYHGTFFESNSTIAKATGVSVRTVQNVLKRCEQLNIFVISSRKESTLSGKFRTTSNKIQLLPYKSFEVVKEVVEEVRTVASKVVEKTKKLFTPNKPKNENKGNTKPSNTYKKPTRTEIVPLFMKETYTAPTVSEEEQSAFNERRAKLQAKLKAKYKKNNN